MSDEIIEYKVKITKQAKYYMRDICDYIAIKLNAPEAAKNLLATLKREIKSLKRFHASIKLTDVEPWR
ncbi:MAG: type II toxin-antitoxin system RelE/ParE family toxin, partial [Candidatus Riflebacteria bacterium]|nr:type II toxin-antitoxin system RelE/ParE family toxin [Candidatus Riflebacteria bacterium]